MVTPRSFGTPVPSATFASIRLDDRELRVPIPFDTYEGVRWADGDSVGPPLVFCHIYGSKDAAAGVYRQLRGGAEAGAPGARSDRQIWPSTVIEAVASRFRPVDRR